MEEVLLVQENVFPELMQVEQAPPQRLRRSERVKRSAIPDDHLVYLKESDFDIGVEEDPSSFQEATKVLIQYCGEILCLMS